MTANYKYSRSNTEDLSLPVQIQLSEKLERYSQFFIAFSKSALNFEYFEAKMVLIALVFLRLLIPKHAFTSMHKRPSFWKLCGSERVKDSVKLFKSAKKPFYPNLAALWVKLSKKKLFLVRSEILGLLVNTLTVNYEYSRSNTEKLPLPVQIQLSEKLETFPRLFIAFSKSALNFDYFERKMVVIGLVFLKLLIPKDVFTSMHKRPSF